MNGSTRLLAGVALACVALTGGLALTLLASGQGLLGSIASAPAAAPASESSAADPPQRSLAVPRFLLANQRDVHEVLRYSRTATATDAPVLRELALSEPDPLIVANALRALASVGTVAGDQALLALLRDARLRVRQEAVVAFGRARDEAAVFELEHILRQDDPALRPLALQALANIDSEMARAVIVAALRSPRASPTDGVFAQRPATGDRDARSMDDGARRTARR